MSETPDLKIIIDTREQRPWSFDEYATANRKLDTGDYSVEGLENVLAIERKRNVAEIANNITESRFKDVIDRLKSFKYAFILLEFDLNNVLEYPVGSTIPKRLWSKIRISPQYLLKHIIELQTDHAIHVIFCGSTSNAEKTALAIMKRVFKMNPPEVNNQEDSNNV
jgi:ERCC4-type nuclease